MAIHCIALKPLLSPTKQNPLPIRYKTSISVGTRTQLSVIKAAAESVPWEARVPPNAVCRQLGQWWSGGFSLGVDLGLFRTAVAISEGTPILPLAVSVGELQGEELEIWLLDLALIQDVDEFIIGLPKSSEGEETEESNRVRSVAVRLAVRAAERRRRVYLQSEHGTSCEGLDHMIADREECVEAYAANAMKILERYFSSLGKEVELVVPQEKQLQFNICQGRPTYLDYY